ncbi:MAG: tetratricopeptide repeat protein [Candidatus Nitrosopolaris sp.]|jgi:tetratricopeptide (TPR) repeat protein
MFYRDFPSISFNALSFLRTWSVIETLYYIAVEKFVPIDVVESVFQQTKKQIPSDKSLIFVSLFVETASDIAAAYSSLKKELEGNEMLDGLAHDGWLEKGLDAYQRGDNQEAIRCCNIALEINPNSADALFLKSLALAGLGV